LAYTVGVASEGYAVGAPSGPELLLVGNLEVRELARGVRAAATTLVMRDLAPSTGSVIRNFVRELGWPSETVRHGFFVPPMFWGEESRQIPFGGEGKEFLIMPALLLMLTDDELSLYKSRGWSEFDRSMADSGVDVLDLLR